MKKKIRSCKDWFYEKFSPSDFIDVGALAISAIALVVFSHQNELIREGNKDTREALRLTREQGKDDEVRFATTERPFILLSSGVRIQPENEGGLMLGGYTLKNSGRGPAIRVLTGICFSSRMIKPTGYNFCTPTFDDPVSIGPGEYGFRSINKSFVPNGSEKIYFRISVRYYGYTDTIQKGFESSGYFNTWDAINPVPLKDSIW